MPRPAARLQPIAAVAALSLPFFFNDAANFTLHAFPAWAMIDYAVRVLVLAGLALAAPTLGLNASPLRLRRPSLSKLLACALLLAGAGLALDAGLLPLLEAALPGWPGAAAPPYPDLFWKAADLTFGLALVAVSEELVFRGAVPALMRRLGWGPLTVLLASSALFGAVHWSNGAASVLSAGLIGAAFLAGTRRCNSLWPAVAAHYAVNLLAFA
jgi:hypothetical protein